MMTNLFSIFDPSTSTDLSLNWISITIFLMIIPWPFWLTPSRAAMPFSTISTSLIKEFSNILSTNNLKLSLLILSLFWLIILNNFMGLFPYIFTATSHILITLTLALPIWLSLMIFGWIKLTNHMFTHLVPLGTPMPLASFMVCIESISNIIRPITLSVRLAANMIAGHLLLTLLSGMTENLPSLLPILIPTTILLLILESAVAIIQSYVFVILSTLYVSEIN